MSEKRKDNKGRILRDNESQRSDGRYEFKFVDRKGERHSVYSWRLVQTDRTPPGKRHCEPLREIEKHILHDTEEQIDVANRKQMTLNMLFDEYMKVKTDLKDTTRSHYKYIYQRYVRNTIGSKPVSSIRFTDIKKFYVSLLDNVGIKPITVEGVQTILHPVFQNAVRDGLIRINPTDGAIAEIKRSYGYEKPKRKALTIPQQTAFITYVAQSRKYAYWLPLFTFLLGTGCRIGEAAGLRWKDCDFENRLITIDHALTYQQFDDGSTRYKIMTPKTSAGKRVIPMLNDVYDSLRREYARQSMVGFNEAHVDGYFGFVFCNLRGSPIASGGINEIIKNICTGYNKKESAHAKQENREPVLLPHFTAHQLRHTFCTRFCENETNLKVIQEIMGHANISITMDVYNEATMEKKIESFMNLEGKVRIS